MRKKGIQRGLPLYRHQHPCLFVLLVPSTLELLMGVPHRASGRVKDMDAAVIGFIDNNVVIICPKDDGWQWYPFHQLLHRTIYPVVFRHHHQSGGTTS